MRQFHALKVAEVKRETPEAVSIRFEVPADLAPLYAYRQGQHLTLKRDIDGQDVRRSYSICAGVEEQSLQVAVKKIPGGLFSSFANDALKAGDVVEVMPPAGHFYTELDPSAARQYVAFAAGSGITPVLSLARTTLAREPKSRFTLVYGNRRLASTMFHEALWELKDRYLARFEIYHVFSREEQEVELFNGRIDAAKVDAFLRTLIPVDGIDEAFVCGPASMIDEVEAALVAAGVPREHVHVERFGVPGAAVADVDDAEAAEARVTLIVDGVRREIDFHRGQHSILDAGRAAGIDLPFSCKGGMCSTCRARLLEGEVKMAKNYALEPHEVAAGFVLTCQSYPLTGRVVVSFDER